MQNKKKLIAILAFITTLAISAITYSWHGRYGYGGFGYGIGLGFGWGYPSWGYPSWGWNSYWGGYPRWGYPYYPYYPVYSRPVYSRYDEEEINRNRDRERYYDEKAAEAKQRTRAAKKQQKNLKNVSRREEE